MHSLLVTDSVVGTDIGVEGKIPECKIFAIRFTRVGEIAAIAARMTQTFLTA
jgi:hypothetical protein